MGQSLKYFTILLSDDFFFFSIDSIFYLNRQSGSSSKRDGIAVLKLQHLLAVSLLFNLMEECRVTNSVIASFYMIIEKNR